MHISYFNISIIFANIGVTIDKLAIDTCEYRFFYILRNCNIFSFWNKVHLSPKVPKHIHLS
jgi:hypothetical protein